ncbi:MAG: YigZ family protein [Flavobacteriales bacterium]|nr:YigZ family protein [Flavobacteriales bacterium]
MSTYRTLSRATEYLHKERGSKFLSFGLPVENSESVQELLHDFRIRFADASHVCYAYRLGSDGSQYGYSDAGEPANSAGLPIYRQLLAANLVNVLVVVVRYFGGKKLGVPGLIEHYGLAAASCLDEACIIEESEKFKFILVTPKDQGYKAYQLASRMKWKQISPIADRSNEFEITIDLSEWTLVQNLISELQSFEWRSP